METFRTAAPGTRMPTPFPGVCLVRTLTVVDACKWCSYLWGDHASQRFTHHGIQRNAKRQMSPTDNEHKTWRQRYAGLLEAFESGLTQAGVMHGRRFVNARVLTSLENCPKQKMHTDYPGTETGSIKPAGALLAVDVGATLDVGVPTPNGRFRRTRLWIPPGWAAVFDSDVVHAGSHYDRVHHRIHAYLDAIGHGWDAATHFANNGITVGVVKGRFVNESELNAKRSTWNVEWIAEDDDNPITRAELAKMWDTM